MVKKIGDVLREFLKERGWPAEDPCSAVFLNWKSIVGETFGEHSWPMEVEDGTLVVEVDHPGWMQMFLLRKGCLLESVRKVSPRAGIRDLRVRLRARCP
jgi:predicted nucleic acid-binding Zn ribbon protein